MIDIDNFKKALNDSVCATTWADQRRLADELRKDGAMTGVSVEVFDMIGRDGEVRNLWHVIAMRQDVSWPSSCNGNAYSAHPVKPFSLGAPEYFDTGSTVINPEADQALAEMAILLNSLVRRATAFYQLEPHGKYRVWM